MGFVTPQAMHSVIRYYSPTQAVVANHNYRLGPPVVNYTTISVVDNSGNINSIDMDAGYQVYDMEIVDDYLIMCGRYNAAKAFIGSVYIPDIFTSSATVNYHVWGSDVSVFRKMAAFKDQNSDIKVVAVGNISYTALDPPVLPNISLCPNCYSPCPSPYVCGLNFIIETTNPQNYPPGNLNFAFKLTSDNMGSPDFIDDVVVTDNYVVFIGEGYVSGSSCITIHPCSKTNILPDFDNYYYYPTTDEGITGYMGCHMKKDTIAIASCGNYLAPGWSEFDTRIRVIDANSKVMTSSQAFDMNGYKSDPIDLVYVPGKYTLVLLEDIVYPAFSGVNNYSFIHLNPYQSFQNNPGTMPLNPPLPWLLPYTAKGFYESTRSLPFGSMDRTASYNAIVATGGDYWFVKTIPIITNGHNCYNPVSVDVYKLYDITGNYGFYQYILGNNDFLSSKSNPTPTSSMISGSCF